MPIMPVDVLYANAAPDAPFLEGKLLAEDSNGPNNAARARVQPSTGGADVWLPRSSVFLKSPAAAGAGLAQAHAHIERTPSSM